MVLGEVLVARTGGVKRSREQNHQVRATEHEVRPALDADHLDPS
jgi:hypothetical protein